MSDPGAGAKELTARVGVWDVVFTMWPAPGAEPVVTRGLIAERTMIGPFLQEVMRPAPGSATPDFRRIDYLSYDRVEGRWKYVSMDTRFPAGIMPAWSFSGDEVFGKGSWCHKRTASPLLLPPRLGSRYFLPTEPELRQEAG
jgi:hypothetical protein